MSGVSRETDLIVYDNMHRSMGSVIRKIGQMEGFKDDPLATESSITVKKH